MEPTVATVELAVMVVMVAAGITVPVALAAMAVMRNHDYAA
jgi:hypothetical protein